ncbi:hypothetical protein AAU57_08780 [Nonlabens sp. YIK11]|uniref:hypothetical protein n=1 Tax=Nonlabens sp. YIK11 TaxID=1453349 RepID=UPI0006DC9C3C|nr:hypothetical protein [Nonlabens sp. YIK11]KQC33397.1 hypothetical protein AAU57_08780 [Nonlabens sp. YIK11]
MINSDEIIKQEIEVLLDEIKAVYNASGKRASGQFEQGLQATYTPNKAVIMGYPYLAGRGATKNGHTDGEPYLVESIRDWIVSKGITPIEATMSVTSLAWAIATKIHKEGTSKQYHLKIYEEVITPQRIDDIIKKVSVFNVTQFTNELTASLNLLVQDI